MRTIKLDKFLAQLDYQKQRMATAWEGDDRHYRLRDVQRRHLVTTAQKCGYGDRIENTLQELAEQTPGVIEAVSTLLPDDFPQNVFESISSGLQKMSVRLLEK